jgi:hypothetical protein
LGVVDDDAYSSVDRSECVGISYRQVRGSARVDVSVHESRLPNPTLLSALPGCKQNLVLTQTGGPGEFNVVTLVEWANGEALSAAKSSVDAQYAQEGFDPVNFMKSLGIRGD